MPGPSGRPLLVAYGDSITVGYGSGGTGNAAAGYADRFGERWIVSNRAVSGSSATCYGQAHVEDVVSRHPDAVLVAYGTNDITGDIFHCRGTIDQFRTAIDSILDQLAAGLPGVPVFVGAILPRAGAAGTKRPMFNQVLAEEVLKDHVQFVDPSGSVTLPDDFVDGLHPNTGGYAMLASFWLSEFAGPGSYPLVVRRTGAGSGIVKGSPGTVNCGTICYAALPPDAEAVFTADPDVRSYFTGWGGACAGVGVGDPCAVTVGAGAEITAGFAPLARPDAGIKLVGDAHFVGDGIYNHSGQGQTRSTQLHVGRKKTFTALIQNDGRIRDDLVVWGHAAIDGTRVTYLRGLRGDTDITDAIVAGTFSFTEVAPGGERYIRMIVEVSKAQLAGQTTSWPVRVSSAFDAQRFDVAQARIDVRA
jgi:lysophospholipase L1-like esterase